MNVDNGKWIVSIAQFACSQITLQTFNEYVVVLQSVLSHKVLKTGPVMEVEMDLAVKENMIANYQIRVLVQVSNSQMKLLSNRRI